MKKAAFYTLGCKVNQYETEVIKEAFKNSGYTIVDFKEKADVYVVNTCSVTHLSDRKSRQIMRRAKQINRDAVLIVCGCYAQTAPNEVAKIPDADIIVGNSEKNRILELLENFYSSGRIVDVSDIEKEKEFSETPLSSFDSRCRAYIKVQDGCRQFCSYCIIPYARGPLRSRKAESVIEEAMRLAENGFCEIVLTGIHLASYGIDTKTESLTELIISLHKIEGIKRIRLGSLEPNVVNNKFIDSLPLMPKLCPQFHIALQSGSDSVLHRMNRKYTTEKFARYIERIKEYMPDVAITTDVMVGFPGETDEEFSESLKFVESCGFSKVHVFPYSPRKNTPAAAFENQVPAKIKEKRAKLMQKLADKLFADYLKKQMGKTLDVLFEQEENGGFLGHTEEFCPVYVKTEGDIKNKILPVKIINCENERLLGEFL